MDQGRHALPSSRRKTGSLFRKDEHISCIGGREGPMPQAKLTIGELEAGYPMYCKALRRLLQQGKSAKEIERTVCWGHLETLNRCLPTRYKSPSYLLALIRRDIEKPESSG